jgi:hypothetical protein
MIVGVAKGPDRKAGMENLILPGQELPLDVWTFTIKNDTRGNRIVSLRMADIKTL